MNPICDLCLRIIDPANNVKTRNPVPIRIKILSGDRRSIDTNCSEYVLE
jgi:hypothetical protein